MNIAPIHPYRDTLLPSSTYPTSRSSIASMRGNLERLNTLLATQNAAIEALRQDYESFASSARADLQKVSDTQAEIKLIISYLTAMEREMECYGTRFQKMLEELNAQLEVLKDKETVHSYQDKVHFYKQNIELCASLASAFIAALPAIKCFLERGVFFEVTQHTVTHAFFSHPLFVFHFAEYCVGDKDFRRIISVATYKIINLNQSPAEVLKWLINQLPKKWTAEEKNLVAQEFVNMILALKDGNFAAALSAFTRCLFTTDGHLLDHVTVNVVPALNSSIKLNTTTTLQQKGGLNIGSVLSGMALWTIAKAFAHHLIPEPNQEEKAAMERLRP